jgi:NADH dehydrogenase
MKILLIGGRGFFATAVADQLRAHDVYTLDRDVGGNNHFQADILDEQRLVECFTGMDVIVNFVGLSPLYTPAVSYEKIHVQGVASIVQAANQVHIPFLAHVSALGASTDASTEYLRTKARGEQSIHTFDGASLIIRPSVLFDTNSEFLMTLAKFSWTRMFPKVTAHMQPVYRLDIARWFAHAFTHNMQGTYELAGPDIMNLTDIAELVYTLQGHSMLRLPSWTAHLSATVFAKLPSTRISADQVRSLDFDNVLEPDSDAFQIISPTSMFDWMSHST